jgi:tripartite-type tricarboxylate transporter receptor subunit TctC
MPTFRSLLAALLVAGLPAALLAQTFPAKPITIVVPFTAGGGTDAVIRGLSPALAKELGQPVIVENRPGAGGTIGSTAVAAAAADGYTLGMATTSTHAIAGALYKGLKYDALQSFAPIGLIGQSPYVLVARPGLPAQSVPELIRYARANPGKLSYASVGAGTLSHLIAEQFKAAAKVDMAHIPYKGAAPAQTDLMGGQVDLLFDNPVTVAQQVRTGRMKALAQTQRNALLTEVPLFSEVGLPGFDAQLWYGLVAPARTPPAVLQRLSAALAKVLADRQVAASLQSNGVTPADGNPATMLKTMTKDVASWGRIVHDTGVQLD